jgi:hypothetical protein
MKKERAAAAAAAGQKPDWENIRRALKDLCHAADIDVRAEEAIALGSKLTDLLRATPLGLRVCCVLAEVAVANGTIRLEWIASGRRFVVAAHLGVLNWGVFESSGEPIAKHYGCTEKQLINAFRFFIHRPGAGIADSLDLADLPDYL